MTGNHEIGLTETGIERLFVKLEKSLFNVAYRWLWNHEDAADVVQEAFVRLWKARNRICCKTVEPYLYRIAINLAKNRRRNAQLRRFLAFGFDFGTTSRTPDPEAVAEHRQLQKRICQAIDTLPESMKSVIVLCEFSDMSYEDIGEALGIPVGTVGSRRNHALKCLKQALGPLMEEGNATQAF